MLTAVILASSALLSSRLAPGSAPVVPATRVVTVAASEPEARWRYPLPGAPEVTARFAPPPERWLPGHRGIDLQGTSGTAVRSVAGGTVVFAGRIAGVGIVSVLLPDGTRATYQPVAPLVHEGSSVSTGEVLGTLEDSHRLDGHCPTTCLHLGAKRGDGYVDPAPLFGVVRARLVPYLAAAP